MKQPSAFTLIELLIVVAIIGILAAIALPNFMNAQVRAKVARAQSEMRTIENALQMYQTDRGAYPSQPALSGNFYFGYTMLTTPVAYLSGLLDDPFARANMNEDLVFDDLYEFTFGQAGRPNTTELFLTGNLRWNMYMIESVGPDGIDDFYPSLDFPAHPPQFQFYAPSNGLRSRGDLVRAGGVRVPSWYAERRVGPETAR